MTLDEARALAERLRGWKHAAIRRDGSTLGIMREAADELERLREKIDRLEWENKGISEWRQLYFQARAHAKRAEAERDAALADAKAVRELMNSYNLGGWTDAERLQRERDALRKDAKSYVRVLNSQIDRADTATNLLIRARYFVRDGDSIARAIDEFLNADIAAARKESK